MAWGTYWVWCSFSMNDAGGVGGYGVYDGLGEGIAGSRGLFPTVGRTSVWCLCGLDG